MLRERYDDETFYKSLHDYIYWDQQEWAYKPDLWLPSEAKRLPAHYSYAEYRRRYDAAIA